MLNRRWRAVSSAVRRLIVRARSRFASSTTASRRLRRSNANATVRNEASADSRVPSRASVSDDLPDSVTSSNTESQLDRVSGTSAPEPPTRACSAGSTISMNVLAPGGGCATQTTPRRTDSVQGGARSRVRPGSASAVGRGMRATNLDSASVISVTQVSICSASFGGSTSASRDAGSRLSSVPGNPLATRLKVVPSSPSALSAATPSTSWPDSRRITCCAAACCTPSLNSTRNRLTAPRSMSHTLPGSSMSTGRLPAQGTGAPAWAASSANDAYACESAISPTSPACSRCRPRRRSARRACRAAPRCPCRGR